MRLESGSHLWPYEITGPLRATGRGEVYRARDTRPGREVPAFAGLRVEAPSPTS